MTKTLKLLPKRKGKAVTSIERQRQQIDFKTFYEDFYKKKIARNSKLCKVSSNVAWSEIRTKIKGSSFKYFEFTLCGPYNPNDSVQKNKIRDEYARLQPDQGLRAQVFEIFESYEQWKQENNYFDIEDFVGLFYRKIKKWPYEDFNFDLIVIDEVQDLSFNSIKVLTNLCLNNFLICGDNAQNIEKGINFKFKELRSFLASAITNRSEKIVEYGDYVNQAENLSRLSQYHLGLNFRSSKQILDLANFVVCLLETYFGDEIDSFPKERGFFSSPRPVVVELGTSVECLVDILETYLKMEVDVGPKPEEKPEESMDQSAALLQKKVKVGSDFCVIVRDEAAKALVPEALQSCIVLTLQESKGLEFENVLLYNHFTNNDSEKGWRFLFTRTSVQEQRISAAELKELLEEKDLFRRSKLELCRLVQEGRDSCYQFSTSAQLDHMSTQAQLEGLSADLKFLYVAITRAKKNFIIFDSAANKQSNGIRQDFDRMCNKLGIAQFVDADSFRRLDSEYQVDANWRAAHRQMAREKGYCFLKQGEYLTAERFFKVSNDQRLIEYCKASEKAKMAGDLLSLEFDDEMKKKYSNLAELQKHVSKAFSEAAEIFGGLQKWNEAGKCYFSAEDYAQAAESFGKMDNKLYLAHSLFMVKKYEEALPLYYELEQDDLVQACLYNLAEGGKDMTRFAAMLAGMSDEAKEVSVFDDSTFLRYLKNIFDEVKLELDQDDQKDLEPLSLPEEPQLSQLDQEEEMSEKPEPKSAHQSDSFVVVSEKNSLDDFVEVKSVVSELKSLGGSFELVLSSIKSSASDKQFEIASKVVSKLEVHRRRIESLLGAMPGSDVLFHKRDNQMQSLMFDLAILYKFEDVGLQMMKDTGEQRAEVLDRLILNKMLNLDLNLLSTRRVNFAGLGVERSRPTVSENLGELITLNIFDIISSLKLGPGVQPQFQTVDDIIKYHYFSISLMGLAEFFYPLAVGADVRLQLALFVGHARWAQLHSGEDPVDASFVDLAPQPASSLRAEPAEAIVGKLDQLLKQSDLEHRLLQPQPHDLQQVETALDLAAELFRRIADCNRTKSEEQAQELAQHFYGFAVWRLIKLLRVLLKKRHALKGSNSRELVDLVFRKLGLRNGERATLARGRYDDFVLVSRDSWLLQLAESCSDLKSALKLDKDCVGFAINRDKDLFLVEKTQFSHFGFTLCVNQLLAHYKVGSFSQLVQLEIFSKLSAPEKAAIKIQKLYSKKFEEIMFSFDYGISSLANIEDYFFSKAMALLRSGQPDGTTYFCVYQNYGILDRGADSSKVAARLVRAECVKRNDSRVFFLLEETDECLRKGEVANAYFKNADLFDYCEQNQVETSKSVDAWLNLREILILALVYGAVPPLHETDRKFHNYRDHILLPDCFRAEVEALDWVVRVQDRLFLDASKLKTEGIATIEHGIQSKFATAIAQLPKSVYSLYPELQAYLKDISSPSDSGTLSSPRPRRLLQALPSEPGRSRAAAGRRAGERGPSGFCRAASRPGPRNCAPGRRPPAPQKESEDQPRDPVGQALPNRPQLPRPGVRLQAHATAF